MKKLLTIVLLGIMAFSSSAFGQEKQLKDDLTKAENDLIYFLSGKREAGGYITEHSVQFSWSPGSKRKLTIQNHKWALKDGARIDIRELKYEIELIQGGHANVIGSLDGALFYKIFAPSVKIKKTENGQITDVSDAFINRPYGVPIAPAGYHNAALPDFPTCISNLCKAAQAYWNWAKDRG